MQVRARTSGAVRRRFARFAVAMPMAVLLAASTAAGPGAAQPEVPAALKVEPAAVPECPEQVRSVDEAVAAAVDCGDETRVGETMSEFATGFATATGNVRMEYTTSAVRQDSDRDGRWAPVDVQVQPEPELHGELAGMIPVTGGVEPVWLNPGGVAGEGLPLVVLGAPEKRVSMFSASLPPSDAAVGVVDEDGRRVTYSFGQGVDLVVSVNVDGTTATPVVRVADRAALKHLAEDLLAGSQDLALTFPLQTARGLQVRDAATGQGFEVSDSDGDTVWESGTPLMWDSTGSTDWDRAAGVDDAAPARAGSATVQDAMDRGKVRLENPVAGDAVAMMDVAVRETPRGGAVTVTPDAEMLADPDLTMPLLLDPKIGAPDPAGWAMVQNYSAWKDTPSWKFSGSEGVGLCDPNAHTDCTRRNVQRLLWRFSALRQGSAGVWLGNLKGTEVIRAEFAVNGTHSFDCHARSVDVYGVGTYVGSGTVWDDVNWNGKQDRWTGTHRDGCSARTTRAEFNVTARVRTAANSGESWIALGMRAADEGSMNWWKRYNGSSGTLSILFDRPPLPPTKEQTEIVPAPGAEPVDCADWANRVQVRDATPQLKSRAREPDGTTGVKIRFRVESQATRSPIWYSNWSSPAGAGTWRSVTVPGSAGLQSGKTYRWRVQVTSTDPVSEHRSTTAWSDSPLCFFAVDTDQPNPPKVTSSNYPERQVAGGVGTPISVTFSANGSGDVARYWYSLNSQTYERRKTPGYLGGPGTTGISITRPGLNYVAVYSEDDAGLVSDPTIYEFYVGFPFTTGHWQFNDAGWTDGAVAGTATNRDDASIAGDLTATGGVTWTPGAEPQGLWPPDPSGNPDGRVPDGAWLFNADPATQDDVAVSVEPVVNGTESFTVSAFLRADAITRSGAAVTQVPTPAETVDGDYRSSFHLGVSKSQDCPTEADPTREGKVLPCWAFWHVRNNDPNSPNVASRTPVPVGIGEWTHVVGVYDANTESLQAWACPMFAFPAERPAAGAVAPFEVDEDRDGSIGADESWNAWNVAGHLRLGSGMRDGNPVWPFHGAVDEVRVAAGHIYDETALDDICKGADVP
ncbi:hypothetical protein [Promicromonospora aerolata]|uniref:Concanavalin A-like lectin/glucanase superfamily protein n=1 Tax=Promicromonospora aerolata TaxID=195749 RepID=A0ABW4VAF9_9MICO